MISQIRGFCKNYCQHESVCKILDRAELIIENIADSTYPFKADPKSCKSFHAIESKSIKRQIRPSLET